MLVIYYTRSASTGTWNWMNVQTAFNTPIRLEGPDRHASKLALGGQMTPDAAKRLFAAAGQNYDAAYTAANKPGFRARPLGLTFTTSVRNKIIHKTSQNVVAVLPGTTRPQEYIIYSAHWDHLGIGPAIDGDSIYNGAVDNALGCAALLATATAFKQATPPPGRSIVFLAFTAEEKGLLGSAYYAAHPLFPRANTVADLNSDVLTTLGPMRDFTVTGYGQSALDDYARTAAKEQNHYVQPDPEPELGNFYRSDHFSFAKAGVPVLYGGGYYESRLHSKAAMEELVGEYHAKHYHQPSDEYDAKWNLRGAEQDVRLLFRVGQRLASETTFPQWKPGSEFQAIREKSRPGPQGPAARPAAGVARAQE